MFQTPFIRGTLDKLGIFPDMDHIGDYKTAMNTMTETSYTAAHKEMMDSLIDNIFSQLVRDIAEDRDMEEAEIERLIDNGPFIAQDALDAGLVDALLYRDEVLDLVERKAGKKKLISSSTYLRAAGRPHGKGKHRVALITGEGAVVRGKSGYNPSSGELFMGATSITREFRRAADNDKIEAIIFRIDSPGGSYVASDLVWREVARARKKKPVVVSMSDVAGSGGYFVALPANRIIAEPGTITASIGVLSGKMNMKGFYDKIGYSKDMVKRGRNASMYWDYQNFTPSERLKFKTFLDRIYMDFSTKVAEARDMEWEEVDRIARGRVWMGEQAIELGLIDELGGMETAVEAVKELLEIPDDEGVRLVLFPKPESRINLFLEKTGGDTRSSLSVLREQLAVVQNQIRLMQMGTGTDGALRMPVVEP